MAQQATATPPVPDFVRLAQPTRIDSIIDRQQWLQLAEHFHNGNNPTTFVMGLIGEKGEPMYAHSKKTHIERAIQSSWDSILHSSPTPFAVAAVCSNSRGDSHWACIDIDAHLPTASTTAIWQWRRIMGVLHRRLLGLVKEGVTVLAETSGRGFHIFLVRAEYWSTGKWRKLLACLLAEALPDGGDGIELFPSSGHGGARQGKAARLPGSANPNTWDPASGRYCTSEITSHFNLDLLLARLAGKYNQRGSSFGCTKESGEAKPATKGRTPAPPVEIKPVHALNEAKRVLGKYSIIHPSTRHNQLVGLVSEGFFNFGKEALRTLATQQYHAASCIPASTLACHLMEFEEVYSWSLQQYPDRLSTEESRVYSGLRLLVDREAFVIAQNFARYGYANRSRGKDGRFPLSAPELGSRLDVSLAYGHRIRRRLEAAGCLRCVEKGGPPNRANMYIWTLPLKDQASDRRAKAQPA